MGDSLVPSLTKRGTLEPMARLPSFTDSSSAAKAFVPSRQILRSPISFVFLRQLQQTPAQYAGS